MKKDFDHLTTDTEVQIEHLEQVWIPSLKRELAKAIEQLKALKQYITKQPPQKD